LGHGVGSGTPGSVDHFGCATFAVTFGAHGDNGPWHGWVFAYDGTTLAQTAALCLSPNGFGNSIWSSGAAMPIDTNVTGGRTDR